MNKEEYRLYFLNKSKDWEKGQLSKRLRELNQAGIELTIENIPLIIEEMSFRVRSKKHSEECKREGFQGPYETGIPCHKNIKDLNCFLCSCLQYNLIITEEGYIGKCKINSKFRKYITLKPEEFPDVKILDCSDCKAYHHPKAVEKYLKDNINNLR